MHGGAHSAQSLFRSHQKTPWSTCLWGRMPCRPPSVAVPSLQRRMGRRPWGRRALQTRRPVRASESLSRVVTLRPVAVLMATCRPTRLGGQVVNCPGADGGNRHWVAPKFLRSDAWLAAVTANMASQLGWIFPAWNARLVEHSVPRRCLPLQTCTCSRVAAAACRLPPLAAATAAAATAAAATVACFRRLLPLPLLQPQARAFAQPRPLGGCRGRA